MRNLSKLILGSAHWGGSYGVAQPSTRMKLEEITGIASHAAFYGTSLIDTARLYPNSEEIIGQAKLDNFEVITKTIKFNDNNITEKHAEKLKIAFKLSLRELGRHKVHALLFHQAADILKPGGYHLIDAVNELKSENLIDKFGVSVYYSDAIEKITQILAPDIVQLPFSLFDQRFLRDGTIEELSSRDVEIHARSLFLQGLPFLEPNKLPTYFKPWQEFFRNFSHDCCSQNITADAVCTSFINSINEIDGYVVGINSKEEIDRFFVNLTQPFISHFLKYECHDDALLDPSQWRI